MSADAIRPCRPADTDALTALWIASWNATLPEVDFADRAGWFRDWLAGHLTTGETLCAESAAREIIGFAGFDPSTGHMEQIAVAPAAFGSGVGKALLDGVKAACPGGVTLHVNQENPRAVAFYRREGFVVTGEGFNPGGQRPIYFMAWRPAIPRHDVTLPERP